MKKNLQKEKALVFLSVLAITASTFVGTTHAYANNTTTLPLTETIRVQSEAVPLASSPEETTKTTTKTTTSTKKLDTAATKTKTVTKNHTDTKTTHKMVGYDRISTYTTILKPRHLLPTTNTSLIVASISIKRFSISIRNMDSIS